MPQDKFSEIKRIISEIDLLKSEINQRLDRMERRQRELERMVYALDEDAKFGEDGSTSESVAETDEFEEPPTKEAQKPNPKDEKPEESIEKLDGVARKGKMSSLLEKYSK